MTRLKSLKQSYIRRVPHLTRGKLFLTWIVVDEVVDVVIEENCCRCRCCMRLDEISRAEISLRPRLGNRVKSAVRDSLLEIS